MAPKNTFNWNREVFNKYLFKNGNSLSWKWGKKIYQILTIRYFCFTAAESRKWDGTSLRVVEKNWQSCAFAGTTLRQLYQIHSGLVPKAFCAHMHTHTKARTHAQSPTHARALKLTCTLTYTCTHSLSLPHTNTLLSLNCRDGKFSKIAASTSSTRDTFESIIIIITDLF